MEISKAFKIAHSSASSTSLFLPGNTLFSLHQLAFLSFQHTVAPMLPLSSFDSSVYKTSPGRYFVASSNACFLFSIIIFSLKQVPVLINSTSSTLFAGSIECSIVISQASHCLYEVGRALCVHIRESSSSSPG